MFLESYLELPLRWDRVRASMLRHPRPWLQGLAEVVDRAGQRLLVEVGLPIRGHELTRRAWLEVGEPVATDGVVSLPLRLRVADQEWLFPSLEGTLDATWLGDARTYLALSAQYAPPLGVAGRLVDRALLHRVAEAVARRFLDTVPERLTVEAASNSEGPRVNHV